MSQHLTTTEPMKSGLHCHGEISLLPSQPAPEVLPKVSGRLFFWALHHHLSQHTSPHLHPNSLTSLTPSPICCLDPTLNRVYGSVAISQPLWGATSIIEAADFTPTSSHSFVEEKTSTPSQVPTKPTFYSLLLLSSNQDPNP